MNLLSGNDATIEPIDIGSLDPEGRQEQTIGPASAIADELCGR